MSLRLRLIVAFFALSVVPLAAVTLFTYTSNVKAVQTAATREADLLAGEMTQRMQLVTAQLSERVEHLMDVPASPTVVADVSEPKTQKAVRTETKNATPAADAAPKPSTAVGPMTDADVDEKVAQALGDFAMLLNNVDLTGIRRFSEGLRGGRPGGGDRSGPSTAGGNTLGRTGRGGRGDRAGANGQGANANVIPAAPATATTGTRPSMPAAGAPPSPLQNIPPTPPNLPTVPPVAAAGSTTTTASAPPARPAGPRLWTGRGRGGDPQRTTPPPGASGSGTPPVTIVGPGTTTAGEGSNALRIDLSPLRQQIYQQMFPQGVPENLTAEQRQAVGRELMQRVMGIQQGIQIGASELQKRAAEAQKSADAQARADATAKVAEEKAMAAEDAAKAADTKAKPADERAPASDAKAAVSLARVQRKTALSGNRLDVSMEQDGKVVQHVNAEINLQTVLSTVFSTTRTDRGEVPFAIGKDGHVFTPTDADRKKIEGLGAVLKPDGPQSATTTIGDWIVVTTTDPSGSGLKFGIARPVGDSMDALRRTAARNASFGLLFIGLAIAGIVPLSTRLTKNLSTLTDGVGRIARGDYGARVPVKSQDEVGRLAAAFNQMAADVERHQHAAVEQERIRRELELGRQIQHEMLPHAPMRLGLTEVQGVSVPAREVGGDFFNYFEVGDGQIALLVGDVSGKGVGAALLMANIQASLRTRLKLGKDLSAIADAIDHDIEDNSPGPVYATLFVGILDPARRTLRYVNAGHHPQYVLRRQGGLDRMGSTGLPVGLFAGNGYKEREVQLGAGDVIFFYTDGCVEAENASGEMFGAERLEALLTSEPVTHSADLLHRVETGVKSFRGNVEPFDDETMMAVRVG